MKQEFFRTIMTIDKTVKIIIWGSLVGTIIGLALSFYGNPSPLLSNACASLFLLSGSYYLLRKGTLIESNEFKIILLGIALLTLAIMLKIMHWQGANVLFGISILTIIATYSFHFLKKRIKNIEDWGKLIFVISLLTGRFLKILHWPYGDELTLLSLVIFSLLVVYIIQKEHSKS